MTNTREHKRKFRIDGVKRMLLEASREKIPASYKTIVAFCMTEFGVARRTAKEYIDCLIDSEYCIKDGDMVYIPPRISIADHVLTEEESSYLKVKTIV